MNRQIIFCILAFILFNCKDETNKLINDKPETFILQDSIGINQEIANDYIQLTIDSVISDSRCPLDVKCIWEGNAEVRLIAKFSNSTHTLILNTNSGTQFPSDTTINEVYFKLISLKPYPETTAIIEQEDYIANVLIEKRETTID